MTPSGCSTLAAVCVQDWWVGSEPALAAVCVQDWWVGSEPALAAVCVFRLNWFCTGALCLQDIMLHLLLPAV